MSVLCDEVVEEELEKLIILCTDVDGKKPHGNLKTKEGLVRSILEKAKKEGKFDKLRAKPGFFCQEICMGSSAKCAKHSPRQRKNSKISGASHLDSDPKMRSDAKVEGRIETPGKKEVLICQRICESGKQCTNQRKGEKYCGIHDKCKFHHDISNRCTFKVLKDSKYCERHENTKDEDDNVEGKIESPAKKGDRRICQGIRHKDNEQCISPATNQRGTYCGHHKKQDPDYDKSAFEELENKYQGGFLNRNDKVIPVETIDELDRFIVAKYQIVKESNSVLNWLKKTTSLAKPTTRDVVLIVYEAGIIIEYTDPNENRSFEIHSSGNLSNIKYWKEEKKNKQISTILNIDIKGNGKSFICPGNTAEEICDLLTSRIKGCNGDSVKLKKLRDEFKKGTYRSKSKVNPVAPVAEKSEPPEPKESKKEKENGRKVKNSNSPEVQVKVKTEPEPELSVPVVVASGSPFDYWFSQIKAAADEAGEGFLDSEKEEAFEARKAKIITCLFRKNTNTKKKGSEDWFTEKLTFEDEEHGQYAWWGKVRKQRDGRPIGYKDDLEKFHIRLAELVYNATDLSSVAAETNEPQTKYIMEEEEDGDEAEEDASKLVNAVSVLKAEPAETKIPIENTKSKSPEVEPESGSGVRPYRQWLDEVKEWADEAEKKCAHKSGCNDNDITVHDRAHARNMFLKGELGFDKNGIKERGGDDHAGRGMHSFESEEFKDDDGNYFWGHNADRRERKIGNKEDLAAFASELDELLQVRFAPKKEKRADGKCKFAHFENTRPAWSKQLLDACWDKMKTGKLYKAWKDSFRTESDQNPAVPNFVNDTTGFANPDECLFRVDMYGNVVSRPGKVQHRAVCSVEIDHVFPWSRGGMSYAGNDKTRAIANVEAVAWMANQRKNDKFLHGPLYLTGWCGENASKEERLDNGLSVNQFIALWKYIHSINETKKSTTRAAELVDSPGGKTLIDNLTKKNYGKNSWERISKLLSSLPCGIEEENTISLGKRLEFALNINVNMIGDQQGSVEDLLSMSALNQIQKKFKSQGESEQFNKALKTFMYQAVEAMINPNPNEANEANEE